MLAAHPVISNVGKDGWGIMQRWQTVAGQKVMGLKFTAKEGMDPNFVTGSLDAVECKTSFTDLDQDVKSRAFDFKIIRLILSDLIIVE